MEARLRRPNWDAKVARDVRERHPEEVMHHDDGAPFRIEPAQGVIELVAVHDGNRQVDVADGIERGQLHLDRTASTSTHQIEARIHDELSDPGIEPLRIAQPGKVSPGPE